MIDDTNNRAYIDDLHIVEQRLKVLYIIDIMWTIFVINKEWHRYVAFMEGLQVSGGTCGK